MQAKTPLERTTANLKELAKKQEQQAKLGCQLAEAQTLLRETEDRIADLKEKQALVEADIAAIKAKAATEPIGSPIQAIPCVATILQGFQAKLSATTLESPEFLEVGVQLQAALQALARIVEVDAATATILPEVMGEEDKSSAAPATPAAAYQEWEAALEKLRKDAPGMAIPGHVMATAPHKEGRARSRSPRGSSLL